MRVFLPSSVGVCALLAGPVAWAQTSDADLSVRLTAAGAGQFNNGGLLATRVTVFARSGNAARYNGPTSIAGPSSGAAAPGATFSVAVPSLYSPSVVPGNTYTVELTWNDTAVRTASYAVSVVRGSNVAGPYVVTNDRPPAATSISCYPDLSDTSTALYVYWSGPSPRPVDFDRLELHRSTTAGFTPSTGTLVAPLPYGSSTRVVSGLTPDTSYYFCITTVDQYGATSDRCTATPCRTLSPRDAAVDAPIDTPIDTPRDIPADLGVDVGTDLGVDVGTDLGVDVVREAAVDVAIDAGADAVIDTGADVARDAATDLGVDVARDALADVTIDTTVDAAVDAARDTGALVDLGGMAGFASSAPATAPANVPYVYAPVATGTRGEAPSSYAATGLPPGATIDPRTGVIAWLPGFGDVGMMRMITVTATFADGTQARQTFTVTVTCPDVDGDGHLSAQCPGAVGGDCDDARADTAPGAPERCNGIDDNCNGLVDEGDAAALCGPSQACDPATRTCRPRCASASDCAAAPRQCTAAGVCALCTPGASGDATACATAVEGRACLTDATGGVLCGCTADADCGGASSGRVCVVARHACAQGCAVGVERNGCPAGQRCVAAPAGSSTPGVCTADCAADVCATTVPARPICATAAPRTCVECGADGDCNANPDGRVYCDRAVGRCVACVPGRATQCSAAGGGSACLSGGVCGCASDADCGARESGRVCDAFTGSCRGGCRPSGAMGNVCQGGAACVMVTADAGRCVLPVADAGAGDAAVDADDGSVPNDVLEDRAETGADVTVTPVDVTQLADATGDVANDVAGDAGADAGRMGSFEGGCGCRAGAGSTRGLALLVAALAALVARRRR